MDKDGNPVYAATNEIKVLVDGTTHLRGLENGSTSSHESYQANTRAALNGRLLAYVQTGNKPGIVHVTISSPGIQPATVLLKIKSYK